MALLKTDLPRPFENTLRGGQEIQLPRLMPGINRSSYFLLTEAITTTALQN
jgi:hypothetical protein